MFKFTLLLELLVFNCVFAEEVFLGEFRKILHNVSGKAYALSQRLIEIREFRYDGSGPAVYFWLDQSYVPSNGGFGLVSPDNEPSCGMKIGKAADGSHTFRVELPANKTLSSFAGGSFSVWCETFGINFGEVVLPMDLESLSQIETDSEPLECYSNSEPVSITESPSNGSNRVVPDIAKTPQGYNCEPLDDELQVRWRVEGSRLDVELVGIVDDGDYMSFGLSGSNSIPRMIGGDVVVAYDDGTNFHATDFYLSAKSQCSNGVGVCPDESFRFGGEAFNDVSNVTGDFDHGVTRIGYSRPLHTGDTELLAAGRPVDMNVTLDEPTSVIWAVGSLNSETNLPSFHRKIPSENKMITFNRSVRDNCNPIVTVDTETVPSSTTTTTTTPAERNPFGQRLVRSTTTELYARVGHSGGEERGYAAITGRTGWGIAWYINDKLVPTIIMERGTKYRFYVNGGDDTDPAAAAVYHPFYLTSSERGGFAQLSPTKRTQETIFAGVRFDRTVPAITQPRAIEDGTFEPTAVGPLCHYGKTNLTTRILANDPNATYKRYFNSLDRSCANDANITDNAGMLEFTPDENTPNTIYYQCFTHRDLGWKILVRNPQSRPPPVTVTPPSLSPTVRPTRLPTSKPTSSPTQNPSMRPTMTPTSSPQSEGVFPPSSPIDFSSNSLRLLDKWSNSLLSTFSLIVSLYHALY